MIGLFLAVFFIAPRADPATPAAVKIDFKHVLNEFDPKVALGYTLDGHERGDTKLILTPRNVNLIRHSGLHSMTYRLRTELGCEAWHWNPSGNWSDPKNHRGYWISNSNSKKPIEVSYGYFLPRRGNSGDQANNTGFSRLDDGAENTFWKSNPYLSKRYTGEADENHPQWVVIDLAKARLLNEIRIEWGNPFATDFSVQYWNGPNEPDADEGSWLAFPNLLRISSRGGVQKLTLPGHHLVRWVRIWLRTSSHTADADLSNKSHLDSRDREGFAIREIYLGETEKGKFHDFIRHGKRSQTVMAVSSTDPWHRASDIDYSTEQPGFDAVIKSGIGNNLPILLPVPALYGVPEDPPGMVKYLMNRNVLLSGIEIGEEPDGQLGEPADYAALYKQVATEIKKVDPKVLLGGPSLQSSRFDYNIFPQPPSRPRWSTLFVRALEKEQAIDKLNFFSFEWYPFDNVCSNLQAHLTNQPTILSNIFHQLHAQGIPKSIPLFITEYGYSAFGGEPEVTLDGAVMDAEIVGTGLSQEASRLYMYGSEPSNLMDERGCGSYGDNMILLGDDQFQARYKLATFWAEWLITRKWLSHAGGLHKLYSATVIGSNNFGAYPVLHPDGTIAIMILNESRKASQLVRLNDFPTGSTVSQFGPAQYKWHANKEDGFPSKSLPPKEFELGSSHEIKLPPDSITVVESKKPHSN